MRIKINIDDNKKFQEVAKLVDAPRFEEEMNKLRRQINLPKSLIPYADYDEFVRVQIHYKHTQGELERINYLVDRLEILRAQGNDSYIQSEIKKIEEELEILQDSTKSFFRRARDTNELFGLNEEYLTVISKSVICGEVRNTDLDIDFKGKNPRSIKEHRDWYWSNRRSSPEDRKGYRKLADEYICSVSTIQRGINSYESSLYRVIE